MYWLAQQRYVAWLAAGFVPAWLLSPASASTQYPTTQPGFVSVAPQDSADDLWTVDTFHDDSIDVIPPALNLPAPPSAPVPQPISNPLPPAFWSALSVFGLLGLFFALRRLRTQLR
jgi:hypothetical protein